MKPLALSALVSLAMVCGGALAQQSSINDYVRRLVLLAPDLSVQGRASEVMLAELPEAKSAMFAFPLDPAKPYRVYALCDDDCTDIDLLAYDPAGNLIAADREDDAGPQIDIKAGQSGDIVRVVVGMNACEAETCVAGLGLFLLRE